MVMLEAQHLYLEEGKGLTSVVLFDNIITIWVCGEIGYHIALLKRFFGFESQQTYHLLTFFEKPLL